MSKEKKKAVEGTTTTISREDIRFEKSIQLTAWLFLIAFGIFMTIYGVFDVILKLYDIKIEAIQFAYIIFNGTSAALCFGLSSKIRKNRDRKKEIFVDWLIAEFIFCMFAIFSVAVYQW
jgi:hypothetical protein